MSEYTRPERAAELTICRKLRAKILQNPCAACVHREELWGTATCRDHPGRNWWACRDGKTAPTFELDRDSVKGRGT